MARKTMASRRKRSIVDFCRVQGGTAAEAADKFGLSRTHIYRLLAEHEADLEKSDKRSKIARRDDVTLKEPKKLTCACWFCGREYYLWHGPHIPFQTDSISPFICSPPCHDKLQAGERTDYTGRGFDNMQTEIQVSRILKLKPGMSFAFGVRDKKYMELPADDGLEDTSDLVE